MPLPPVIGPLSTAAGPGAIGARVVGVVVPTGAVVTDGLVVCDDDEHPANTRIAPRAQVTVTCIWRFIWRSLACRRRSVGAMDETEMRRRFAAAQVARLATVTPEGRPHLVPCCFVLVDDDVYSAVDAKPKSTTALRRLDNLRAHPEAALLVDHYSDDWSTLWWIRADGDGRVLEAGAEHDAAIAQLTRKYPIYATDPPPGAVIAIHVRTWHAWSARS